MLAHQQADMIWLYQQLSANQQRTPARRELKGNNMILTITRALQLGTLSELAIVIYSCTAADAGRML